MTRKKKILLVSSAFYPEISPRSFRATELAKEFYSKGHAVTVISKFRDHDYTDFLKEFPVTFKMWNRPTFPKVPEFRLKPLVIFGRGLTRLFSLLFEYPGIEEMFQTRMILKNESGYDLMISFAFPYPVHWGVAWSLSGKHQIASKWVADCGDPFMGDVLDSFRKPFYFAYLEKWFCRKANYISIPVESARPAYYPEFQNKIKIIPQGFDFKLDLQIDEKKANPIPEFAYAGGFLKGIRDPGLLMKYLAKTDLPFKFHVFTNQIDLLESYRETMGDKLIVSNYISREDLMTVLRKMDFLINFDNNTGFNVPSKLIDYSILNKPVLNIDNGFTDNDIHDFLLGNYNNRMQLPDPWQYHINNIAGLFMELLDN